MTKIVLGETSGRDLTIDLDVLMSTRMLVQSNSGGGKSRTLRRILEQSHGSVQQIVLDTEGEFGSLREKYDFVYAAPSGGDTIAHPRSAALLAIRLLELRASAIIDLYELPMHERILFVKLYFDAMIDAPKTLWHPVMVVLDETHVYAPEKGKGQAESTAAVIDMAARGRKRGFCVVYATQRIQKLSKDATSDLNNKIIGRATQSEDVKRAAEEIGLARAERRELIDLEPGQFLVAGPAFNVKGIQRVKVGDVRTTHPEAGRRIKFTAAPPTKRIRALLPKLSDLPAEAESQRRSMEDLQKEVAQLKRELSAKSKAAPPPPPSKAQPPKVVEVPVVPPTMIRAVERARLGIYQRLDSMRDEVNKNLDAMQAIIRSAKAAPPKTYPVKMPGGQVVVPVDRVVKASKASVESTGAKLSKIEREMLTVLAQERETHGEGVGITKERLAAMAGYALSGHFTNMLSQLRSTGRAEGSSGAIKITEQGLADLGEYEPRPTGHELLVWWQGQLSKIERELLTVLDEHEGKSLNKEQIAAQAGYAVSGHFTNMLSHLRTLGLIDGYGDDIKLASFLR